jgi:hypothetical protein
MGGTPDDRVVLGTTEIYDPVANTFQAGPLMDTGRYKFDACVDPDGRIIAAGSDRAGVFDPDPTVTPEVEYAASEFQAIAGTFGPVRWFPTVTCLTGGDVLVVGGYDERIRIHEDALLIGEPDIGAHAGLD